MDNSLTKVNHIRHLATKSVDDKNVNLLQKQNNSDLEVVADQFESTCWRITTMLIQHI